MTIYFNECVHTYYICTYVPTYVFGFRVLSARFADIVRAQRAAVGGWHNYNQN